MAEPPTAETVQLFRRATGLGWMASKRFLIEESPELCARIIRAGEEQGRSHGLHDPLEGDPAFAADIAAARERAMSIARWQITRHNRRWAALGSSLKSVDGSRDLPLLRDVIMQKLLQRKGIRWYRPMEMNPGTAY